MAPLGLQAGDLDTVVGEVTDPATVQQAVAGCQAVVHAASIYSLDSRDADRIRQVNAPSTDLVLGAAHRAGLDPIIYVSSTVALLPPSGRPLTPNSPAGPPPGPYLGSKAQAERVAGCYQQAGAPVVTTYPGFVLGPHDPHLGQGMRMVRDILKGRYPMVPTGGFPIVDVRDVAKPESTDVLGAAPWWAVVEACMLVHAWGLAWVGHRVPPGWVRRRCSGTTTAWLEALGRLAHSRSVVGGWLGPSGG